MSIMAKSSCRWSIQVGAVLILLSMSGCLGTGYVAINGKPVEFGRRTVSESTIDETQWTTVTGPVRSQYGTHPAMTNLRGEGTFMSGKTFSVVTTIYNISIKTAYARLFAHAEKHANDPAWSGLLRITSAIPGDEECSISEFQKATPSATKRGIRTQYDLQRVANGVKLRISSIFSPGLYARVDDIIRDYAGTIDAVSAGQERIASAKAPEPAPLQPPAPEIAPTNSTILDVDVELEKMIEKFTVGLQAKKIAKVAVLDVIDLQGRKSELGRSLEEKWLR